MDTLVLDNNPLGPDGGAAIIEALARKYVRKVTMFNCNFTSAAQGGGAAAGDAFFDVSRPNRVYRLDLSKAAQYAVAGTLVRYWRFEGPQAWKTASLDGQV